MALLAFGAETKAASDTQEIVSRGKIVVAMRSTDLPPFLMSSPDDGSPYGYDVDIAKGIAAELGVSLQIDRKAQTFNELVDLVDQGQADIAISKLSRTLNRAKRVVFTQPYLVLRKGLMINRLALAQRRGEMNAQDFVKSYDGGLGVLKGSSYAEFAKTMFPKAKLREYDNWQEAVRDVDEGRLLGVFRDDLEIKRSMRGIPGASLKLLSVSFKDSEDPIAIAVGGDKLQLRYWLDQYLDERKLRLDAEKLLDKYGEHKACPPPESRGKAKTGEQGDVH
jgi:ABC-type amino acid transport substrate-binding protein